MKWYMYILFIILVIYLDRKSWKDCFRSVKRDWREARKARAIRKRLEKDAYS